MSNSRLRCTVALLAVFASGTAIAGPLGLEKEGPPIEPALGEPWQIKLSLPAWASNIRGDEGINGHTRHSVTGFNELANKIDMVAGLRFEVGKGKFGVLGEFTYLSLSDSVGADGAVRKLDFQLDEILGDLGLRWRILEGPNGYLDAIAGVRYTYLHEQLKLQGNSSAISAVANRLSALGPLTRALLEAELANLRRSDQTRNQQRFSRPSPNPADARQLLRELRELNGTTAERAERIERKLRKVLNSQASWTDDWLDPYIGFRGRYSLTKMFYVLGRADISPFDVGADFAWQASAGFGLNVTRNITYEVTYRALGVDYRHDGFIYNTVSYGPEATIGITF